MTRTIDDLRQEALAWRGGIIAGYALPAIIDADPLTPLLIRHAHGRMICAAADVEHHRKIIEQYPGGFVRDVSWPAQRHGGYRGTTKKGGKI